MGRFWHIDPVLAAKHATIDRESPMFPMPLLRTVYQGYELRLGSTPTEGGYVPQLVVYGEMGTARAERQIYLDGGPFESTEAAVRHAEQEGRAWVDMMV